MNIVFGIIILGGCLIHTQEAARILGLFPYNGKSHFVMFETLLKALAARGHQVDVVTHFPQKTPLPNYTDLNVQDSLPQVVNNLSMSVVESFSTINVVRFKLQENVRVCKGVFKHPNVQKLLKSRTKYDLIITEIFGTDCFLGFVHKFRVPYISMISSVTLPWANGRVGNPDNPSYIPNYYLPYTAEMSFFQRVVNTIFTTSVKWYYRFYSELPAQRIAQEYFGKELPPLSDIANNVSLLLVNSHFSLQQPRPMVPAFVEVGGIHIQKPRKLPEDIEKFINDSQNGVIYFSFGSMVRSETIPRAKMTALLEAFSELPQRVLWKCNVQDLEVLPANVKAAKWLPQRDILAHPNVRLFITHGGLLGTQEAISSGVPMLGIPLFADQELNIESYVAEGMAVKLKYSAIRKESILMKIETVLNDPRYKLNARRMAQLFQDRPQSPLETAIYWTEYVIRHGGAEHMRPSAMHLSWYQYYMVDVCLFFVSLLIIVSFLGFVLLKRIFNGIVINYNKYLLLNPSKLKLY